MSACEGNVYLCNWAKLGKSFIIFLQQNPSITVRGTDVTEAEELMWELLCEKFGDGEAVIEYVKPLPKTQFQAKYGIPPILCVSGNDGLGRLQNESQVVEGGVCSDCKRDVFQRTGQVAEFDALPLSDGAVTERLGPIFSEAFLALLTDKERSELQFIAVRGPNAAHKSFFELRGLSIANLVGHRSFPGLLNKRCRTCGSFGFTYLYNCDLYQFIARSDIPCPIPTVFVIGGSDPKLCMTRDRYKKIIGARGAKNITSRQIWVLPDNLVVRNPEDEDYPEELYWKSAHVRVVYKS